jgi:glutathione S-transferase
MQLIGMLDSPYVRRVAISLQLLGLPFEHRSVSVFRGFDAFRQINPVVKAPTLVCDDGEVLMDSGLILEYAESLAAPGRSLMPRDIAARQHALRSLGLALAACEKSVQIVYERMVRPPEKQHAPWVERITGQMHMALRLLDADVQGRPPGFPDGRPDQAFITSAVVWHFALALLPDLLKPADCPALHALSVQAEARPEFRRAPHSEAVYPQPG